MDRLLGGFASFIYAALRIVVGFLFACHGAQKLLGAFGGVNGQSVPIASEMGLAGIIELVGGALICVGLFTSWAAFVASGEMAVAYFKQHAPGGPWPIANGGELAVLYCFVFLYMAARGSGPLSLDRIMGKRT